MADQNHVSGVSSRPQGTSASLPSTPLQVSGYSSGRTIQLLGDTGDLQFSVQFNIHKKHDDSDGHSPLAFPSLNDAENSNSLNLSSSPLSPTLSDQDDENHQSFGNFDDWSSRNNLSVDTESEHTVTRLRSGVLSRVSYFPRKLCALGSRGGFQKRRKSKKKDGGKRDLLEALLERRRNPVRPCNSYSFFVMASWGMVQSSSFGGKSKKLGRMWCKLTQHEKKVYEDMALRDNARYRKQCILLRDSIQEDATEIRTTVN